MNQTLATIAITFLVLAVLFRALDWLQPAGKRLPLLRAGFWTDLTYWIFTPLVTKVLTRLSLIAAIIPVALIVHGRLETDLLVSGFGPLSRLPLWAQAGLILLLSDFISYWMHRLFHGQRLWKFHAIHHSPSALDWLSAVRVHPINDAIMRVASALPVFALGFAPKAVAGVLPFLTFMAILIHANVDWDWGPLRSVVASPRFHRWHHTSEAEGSNKNFAGLFPFWDLLFGTYFMPPGRVPTQFGTDTPVPSDLLRQLIYPFRRG